MTFGVQQDDPQSKKRVSKSQPKSNLKKDKKGATKKQVEFDSDKNEEFEFEEHHNTDVQE